MKLSIQRRGSRILGVILLVSGLVLNKFLLEQMFSSDERIASPTLNVGIVLLQCFVICAGWLVYARTPVIDLSRRSVAMLLLIVFALQSAGREFLPQVGYLDSILKSGYHRNDEVTAYEARFDCIRNALPKNGVIGYGTSQQIRDDWTTFYYHYYLTQYTLAPLVVQDSTQEPLVIGNFPDKLEMSGKVPSSRTSLIEDCGTGVLLLRGGFAE
jgi:hypothetical protein